MLLGSIECMQRLAYLSFRRLLLLHDTMFKVACRLHIANYSANIAGPRLCLGSDIMSDDLPLHWFGLCLSRQ